MHLGIRRVISRKLFSYDLGNGGNTLLTVTAANGEAINSVSIRCVWVDAGFPPIYAR